MKYSKKDIQTYFEYFMQELNSTGEYQNRIKNLLEYSTPENQPDLNTFIDFNKYNKYIDPKPIPPLYRAIYLLDIELIQLLLNYGATPQIIDDNGISWDALQYTKELYKKVENNDSELSIFSRFSNKIDVYVKLEYIMKLITTLKPIRTAPS